MNTLISVLDFNTRVLLIGLTLEKKKSTSIHRRTPKWFLKWVAVARPLITVSPAPDEFDQVSSLARRYVCGTGGGFTALESQREE
jgi:hypothetical protein